MRLGILAIVLSACSPTLQTPPSPPPVVAPQTMALEVGPMTPGAPFTLTVSDATPGDRVFFGYSTDGLGASPPLAALGGLPLGILSPQLIPGPNPVTADATGAASITFTLPASVPSGFGVGVQAAVVAGASSYLSNPLQVEVDGCAEDAHEDDDTPATATLIDYGQVWRGRGCGTDLDWYALDVHADATVQIDLEFLHANGNLDLFLFDGTPPTGSLSGAVAQGESASDDEFLAYTTTDETTLHIAVSRIDDGANGPGNTYDIHVTEASATSLDLDGDGLPDSFEQAHTSPPSATALAPTGDLDGDGLDNAGEFAAGTDPSDSDSDADGAGDWYEVVVAFTDPTNDASTPGVPYPLPDADGSTGTTDGPVKVYILTGQSNMVGFGRLNGPEPGTLESLSMQGKFPNLVDDLTGDWAARQDVLYRGVIGAIGDGPLAPGFAANSNSFGPELGFGHVMGWYHDEPVIVLKSSLGGLSLGGNLLPPGSLSYTVGNTTYAGFGDSPLSWPAGTTPVSTDAYGGDYFDICFRDEADHAPAGGAPVFNVTDVLDNFATEYPQFASQGFEIAGFAWWQGWNDGLSYTSHYANRYEENLAGFIEEVRGYYEDRYPDHIAPDAPFVVATSAFDGFETDYPTRTTVAEAQLAVDGDRGNYPAFAGNVRTMEARGYWRPEGPSGQNYHYHHHAETFLFTGDALGRGMVELLEAEPPTDPWQIDAVYLAQTHVQQAGVDTPNLVGNRDALLKAHVVAPGSVAAPHVDAVLTLDGETLTLPMGGPATLPTDIPNGPGVVDHAFDNSFTATIPAAWMQPGLSVDITAGSTTTAVDDFVVGAPTHAVMRMFDVHFFRETTGDYPAGMFEEIEAKLPVAELEVRRLPRVIFPELVIPPRGGAPAARIRSAAEYLQATGLAFDGEQAAALQWRGALHDASGRARQRELYFINIYQSDSSTTGGQAGGFGGVSCVCTGVFHHELGHALSLPHWSNDARYPYNGSLFGIPAPSQGYHAGPTWAFDGRLQQFIPPTTQPGNAGNQPVGTYKVDPMQGGGSGFQEPGFLLNHFSDYSVNQMQDYFESHVTVWNEDLDAYAKWNQADGDYTTVVTNDGVRHPVEREVEVISIMAAASGASPDVSMAYPPIGPYISGLTTLFDPRVAADRAAAQAIFSPAGGSDLSVRVMQGGVEKIYMLDVSWDPGADPTSGNSLQTAAVNLPAADGAVSRIDLLLTPDAEVNGLPAQPQVLHSWAALLPDPAAFDRAPAAFSTSTVTMRATEGTAVPGTTDPVEYRFTETTGNPGATSSGWQESPTWTDLGLSPSTEYTYTVSMRAGPLEVAPSEPLSVTTPATPATGVITVDSSQQFTLATGSGSRPVTGLGAFDAAGASKLVVAVSTEHAFNNGQGSVLGVTYNGQPLLALIEEDAGADRGAAALYYLDNPGPIGAGSLEINGSNPNGGIGVAYALSGTAPGFGAAAQVTGDSVQSLDLQTVGDQSLVVAVLENSGAPNGAGTPTALSPLTQTGSGFWGSQWGGHASGWQRVASPSVVSNPFSTNTGSGYSINLVAAEFLAAP